MNDIKISNFIFGGLATIAATVFTNPLEVIKTRLQLQGELQREQYRKTYRGVFHAFIQILKYDGISGLYKGMVPALGFNCTMDTIRMGIFEAAGNAGLTKTKEGNESVLLNSLWGGFGGTVASCIGSPFFMIRTQFQSYSESEIAVGYQRKHKGMIHTFKKIYKAEGIRGVYRGVLGNIPRATLGSGAQLAVFGPTKDWLRRNNLSSNYELVNSFVCGLIAGSVMSIAMTPPDMILTRIANQPLDGNGKGVLYKGVFDCFSKVFKEEGINGLYKGFWPNYIRISTHSTLMFLFFDQLKLFWASYGY